MSIGSGSPSKTGEQRVRQHRKHMCEKKSSVGLVSTITHTSFSFSGSAHGKFSQDQL